MTSFFNSLLEDNSVLIDDSNVNNDTDLDNESLYKIKEKLLSLGIEKDVALDLAMKMNQDGVISGLKWGEASGLISASSQEVDTPDGILGVYYINGKHFTEYLV